MFVSIGIYMNDSNIRYYLEQELKRLTMNISIRNQDIRGFERQIDDKLKEIANLKVHYTSLLNTALAYGLDQEEFESTL